MKYELYNSKTQKTRKYNFPSDREAIDHISNNVIAYSPAGYTIIEEGLDSDKLRVDMTSNSHDYVLTREEV